MCQKQRRILVATTNRGKIAEMRAMLVSDVHWMALADVQEIDEIAEDGATFAANARKKALGYAKAAGLWTIADDSGLVVDALDGAPGVKSARFSGEKLAGDERTLIDHRNIAKVLELLRGIPENKRTARFVCRLCLANPENVLIETEGTLEGLITKEEVGENGFGYDPIFFVPGLNKTVAQLASEEKNTNSHRGNAIRRFSPLLDELLQNG